MFSNSYKIYRILFQLVIVFGLTTCKSPELAKKLSVFQNATLIIGDGSAPVEESVVVVEDDRIIQVGRSGEIKIPPVTSTISLIEQALKPLFQKRGIHFSSTRLGLNSLYLFER